MGEVLTGTASWTDRTLLESGWYPTEANNAERRLKYYAEHFPLVEVDSTYYGMPSEQTAMLWAERTPAHFTFDMKGFRLFTGHPTGVDKLPVDIRKELPADLRTKKSVYDKDLPPAVLDHVWEMYLSALKPLKDTGKLGAIFLQYPKWFYFGRDNMGRIEKAVERLRGYQIAVEFRTPSWMNERNAPKTLDFLRKNGIAYTSVDGPQGTQASVPPIAATTTPNLAVVRFHGRRVETWDQKDVGVLERFRYLYQDEELSEWVPKIRQLQEETRKVHVLMNNCYADYGVRNAAQLEQLLQQ